MSAIEIKLETFRYKQTYESYITFSRKAKYGILISIRIVYGGLQRRVIQSVFTFYPINDRVNLLVVYKTQCVSVCLSAIKIKLETFRYKQTYESYITFSREAKYSILISIRIVYGGATSLYLFNLY